MAKLYAPTEYWKMSENEKNKTCNGCGAGWSAGIIPNTIWGLSITECCNIHDWMYENADPKLSAKEEADRIFLNNMTRLVVCKTKWNWLKKLRLRRARLYYDAVNRYGGPAFWSGKNAADLLKEIKIF